MRITFFYLVSFGLVVLSLAARPPRGGEKGGDRIVGGAEVDAHSIPWQVGLMDKGANWIFCGGTILSATKILTAAHCYQSPSAIEVVVGEHSLNSAADGVRHTVASFEIHESYNSQTIDNDVAIITLEVAIDLSDKAVAACLPTSETVPALTVGQLMTVSGWGRLSASSSGPDVLHAVQVPYMTNEQCKQVWGDAITENMLCGGALGADPGVSACMGDSGGPLTVGKTVVGVVSWGSGGCNLQSGVYARVSKFIQWIKNKGVTVSDACNSEQPDVTTQQPDVTTQQPDVTTQEPEVTTQQPEVTTQQPEGEPEHPSPEECNLEWIGDGICDARNNHAGCFFDGNDCCDEAEGWDEFCHKKVDGCKCKKNEFKKCDVPEWAHDHYCDDENNTPDCNYDGGDCCTRKIEYWDYYCTACTCIFPDV